MHHQLRSVVRTAMLLPLAMFLGAYGTYAGGLQSSSTNPEPATSPISILQQKPPATKIATKKTTTTKTTKVTKTTAKGKQEAKRGEDSAPCFPNLHAYQIGMRADTAEDVGSGADQTLMNCNAAALHLAPAPVAGKLLYVAPTVAVPPDTKTKNH